MLFTFFWHDGKRETLKGNTYILALKKSNHLKSNSKELDFFVLGRNPNFNFTDGQWKRGKI